MVQRGAGDRGRRRLRGEHAPPRALVSPGGGRPVGGRRPRAERRIFPPYGEDPGLAASGREPGVAGARDAHPGDAASAAPVSSGRVPRTRTPPVRTVAGSRTRLRSLAAGALLPWRRDPARSARL